ncbi:uncharacterized protein [Elaeis guineensis]|uniref:Uncharacterized protein LOC105035170 isoform X3 n=1 Tax=Elaeis guineensis var. tenera TaxID=51953 RepID=A0A8N4EUN7_ELAGV|nr:uncharacterized protein LOC105035170 isoform X3 [Elaeis guineensis]XP_029117699.1 uncharacterized protein LOC105035170 isoform X3 [Elaeis guineensis]
MGTREVYEEKLRTGNLDHDPTINPGLGSPRCPRCLSLINPNSGNGEWTITSVLHDATAVAGSGAGAMLSAVHGFNTGMNLDSISPEARERTQMAAFLYWATACNHLKGHIVHMHYGELQTAYLPPLLLFSGASAAFGAYAVPKFAQLTVTSYYAASSASHYAISQITRYVEGANSSHDHHDKPR